MLVAAFQVHGAGPFQFRTLRQHAHMAGAGIKPHVHDILFLAEMGMAALGTFGPFRQQFFCFVFPPGIAAFFFKQVGNFINSSFVYQRLIAFFAIEHGNRHAPHPLAADAPVVAVCDHIMDTGFSPGRDPLYFIVDSVQRSFTEPVHRSEPLLGSPVDDGVLATPTMGILVVDILFAQQEAQLCQIFQDGHIGIEYEQALEALACFRCHFALFIYRADDRHIVLQAGQIVHVAMAAGSVDAAGTGFQINVIRQADHRLAMVVFREGMLTFRIFHFPAFDRTQHFAQGKACFRCHSVYQFAGHEQHFVTVFHKGIFKIRIQGHRHVARNGPGCGGPDHYIDRTAVYTFRGFPVVLNQGELYINRRGLLVRVFNFRFRQGRFAVGAPVYRL